MKYNISPPMSRRGSCYVNAMAENFFSILKTECIYRHRPASFEEANVMIDRFIYFCNYERIQLKTGEAPLSQRLSHKPLLFLPGAFCAVGSIGTPVQCQSKLSRFYVYKAAISCTFRFIAPRTWGGAKHSH